MTSLLLIFIISLALGLLFTPLAGKAGSRFNIVDHPDYRKPQQEKIPRTGGLSIFLTFTVSLVILTLLGTRISSLLIQDSLILFFFLGALVCFAIGVTDDFIRLSAWTKLLFQIIAALIAFIGGLQIQSLPFGMNEINSIWLSLPLTVFWFLLLINAVNLIDGLDGLAGGIILFTSLAMTIFLVMDEKYQLASLFLILAGSICGFLPYNFSKTNKIYLGDGGTYFLGYCIAFFSISGSVKSHVSATILIPILAMGLPVFETIFSPLRRIILAKNPLKPDTGHVHHHLLKIGFTSRKALVVLYSFTILMCLLAVSIVTVKNEQTGLFLIIIGTVSAIFLKNIGYFDYIDAEKFRSWLADFSFVTGVAKDRRRFLNLQIAITESTDLAELWQNICYALQELDIDFAEINLEGDCLRELLPKKFLNPACGDQSDSSTSDKDFKKTWLLNNLYVDSLSNQKNLFKLELPIQSGKFSLGKIWLIKDLAKSPINHYTLTRIEHLRRSVGRCMLKNTLKTT